MFVKVRHGDVLVTPPKDGLELLLILSNVRTLFFHEIALLSLAYGDRYIIRTGENEKCHTWLNIGVSPWLRPGTTKNRCESVTCSC